MKKTVPSDLEIAQEARILPITDIAKGLGLLPEEIEPYGHYKAKVKLEAIQRLSGRPNAKYVDVTAINPTPLGEGKTVTTIGLGMALNKAGKKAIVTLRQPSLGPVFGIKGGAAGGGYSQVIPMEEYNLHFTGDVHAVTMAHNLLGAYIDNHIYHGNKLGIDPSTISWPRVMDISDRSLRNIVIGLRGDGNPRETGFDISVASEVMAILALATDLQDLRKRIGKIILGYNNDGNPVTAEDIKCAGAMTILLKEAVKPNLIQTVENTPVFVHAGPFANIAHGNSSIIADLMASKLGEYVVTESGFGADCGAEKFFNIKCRYSGLKPSAVVIVCSIRALKMHSGRFKIVAGKPLDPALIKEDLGSIRDGIGNLQKHIENILQFGITPIVAINKFATDSDNEIALVRELSLAAGAADAVLSEVWENGGEGGLELAKAVIKVAERPNDFKFLYPLDAPLKDKINTIATKIYGAKSVSYLPEAEKKIKLFTRLGFDKLPICMAKTHLSLSHDPKLKGRPRDFVVPIRDVKASIGAGFIYPLLGDMKTMPGLPSEPSGDKMDIDDKGNIVGLS